MELAQPLTVLRSQPSLLIVANEKRRRNCFVCSAFDLAYLHQLLIHYFSLPLHNHLRSYPKNNHKPEGTIIAARGLEKASREAEENSARTNSKEEISTKLLGPTKNKVAKACRTLGKHSH